MDLTRTPPAQFPDLIEELQRQEYERRYWAMVENEHLGIKTTWVGRGPEPESSWETDDSVRQTYLAWLRRMARIPEPQAPTPEDQLAQDRANWQALREQRRRKR